MGYFKDWLELQEFSMGSDAMRDNAPTQDANAAMTAADQFMKRPDNAKDLANINTLNMQRRSPSAMMPQLLKMGAKALDTSPEAKSINVFPTTIANRIGGALGLPSKALPPPKVGKVKMMRKRMRPQ